MRNIRKLDGLLKDLGTRYSIPNLRMPAHGALGLRLKDGIELYLEYEETEDTLYAYMHVMPLPKEDTLRLKLFTKMLKLNFLDSGGESISLSIEEEIAICHTRFNVDELSFDILDRSLQKLVFWRADISNKLKAEGKADVIRPAKVSHAATSLLAAFR